MFGQNLSMERNLLVKELTERFFHRFNKHYNLESLIPNAPSSSSSYSLSSAYSQQVWRYLLVKSFTRLGLSIKMLKRQNEGKIQLQMPYQLYKVFIVCTELGLLSILCYECLYWVSCVIYTLLRMFVLSYLCHKWSVLNEVSRQSHFLIIIVSSHLTTYY